MFERTCINLPNETVSLGGYSDGLHTPFHDTKSFMRSSNSVCVCVCVCVGVRVRSEVTKCSMRSSNFLKFFFGGGTGDILTEVSESSMRSSYL